MMEKLNGSKKLPKSNMKKDEKYTSRKWSYLDIREVHKRLFLFRNVALEFFLSDGRNFLMTFWDTKSRDNVYNQLFAKASITNTETVSGVNQGSDPLAGASKLQNILFGGSSLNELTERWVRREITNFQYLMNLNTLAGKLQLNFISEQVKIADHPFLFLGRSYNDLTQYPVFPWVLCDYTSEKIDLDNPAIYRDLSKPMGAQGPDRMRKFMERYEIWDDPQLPACHYGVHYSSAMIVCSYLIRLEPFTEQFVKLQGGYFDHPDRLFSDIPKAWKSAAEINTNDVRELTPEFFYLPDFLRNANKFNFGVKQNGDPIDDVVLPPWAKGDPKLFIDIHREVLESEYVSAHLHEWVDLIFGYKQQGEEAIKSVNVYHYLSYEGAVDMDAIEDPVEKQATLGIINNFGQTPRQIFKKPHPKRNPAPQDAYFKVQKAPNLLTQSLQPVKTMSSQYVGELYLTNSDKMVALGASKAVVPPNYNRYVEWGLLDGSLRLRQTDSHKVIGVFENLHVGHITSACFADENTLITGGTDMVISIWRFVQNGSGKKKLDFALEAVLRGHLGRVCSLAVSRSFNIIVSGGQDNVVILWDLNRRSFVRSLTPFEEKSTSVYTVAISNSTGTIATCSETTLILWTLNGERVLTKAISSMINDSILSCVFFEVKNNEFMDTEYLVTGQRKGGIKLWQKCWASKEKENNGNAGEGWDLRLLKSLNDQLGEDLTNSNAVVALSVPSSHRLLLSGDFSGKVYTWTLPDGSGVELHYTGSDSCQSCKTKFAVLERKQNCRCCGGSFCHGCIDASLEKAYRLCLGCAARFRMELGVVDASLPAASSATPTPASATASAAMVTSQQHGLASSLFIT